MKNYIYDKFRCIAGDCSFTCCEGWDIDKTDSESCMNMLKEENLLDTENGRCPLLCQNGLCSLVIKEGEAALPKTCQQFPRLIYKNNDKEFNYDLSFACPEVLDILRNNLESIEMLYDDKMSLSITADIYKMIGNDSYPMDVRMMGAWVFLDGMVNGLKPNMTKWDMLDCIGAKMVELDPVMTIVEINELLLDILVNYMEVEGIKEALKAVYCAAEKIQEFTEQEINDLALRWQKYKQLFDDNGLLISLLQKVFQMKAVEALENSDGDVSSSLNFQTVIFEFCLLRYSLFLIWMNADFSEEENKIESYDKLRELIVIYSRIIGHNTEAFSEFMEECFGEMVCDNEYMMLILG